MHPRNIKIEEFTYELPDKNIAYHPMAPRDISKLLIYRQGEIEEGHYRNIADWIPEQSTLVFNNTRVIKSRIFFQRPTGATIEVFCLEPYGSCEQYDDFFQQKGKVLWTCLVGKVGKWKEKQLHKTIYIQDKEVILTAEIVEKQDDCYLIELSWTPDSFTFGEVLQYAGLTPLPPYIKRMSNAEDEETYQTVYSKNEGSVAAPTAGLHFTDGVFESLKQKNIHSLYTTLHVGAGTFMPVKSETMDGHAMHAEMMSISIRFLESLEKSMEGTIISVGTTSARTLESIYWMGNKILNTPDIKEKDLKIQQWEPYEGQRRHDGKVAVVALRKWMEARNKTELSIETQIIIAPGYEFGIVQGLITNFHQPQSTLLLLVSALVGEKWKELYQYALERDFRFLSYGDGNLLLP